jgi:hypothetical protein
MRKHRSAAARHTVALVKRISIVCYMVILSTSSSEDLTQYNTELLKFEARLPGLGEENELASPQKWFVGSKDGCSCAFRHLHTSAVELGFGAPEDWYPEEQDDIDATKQFYSVVSKLVSDGYSVDCVDTWDHQKGESSLSGMEIVSIGAVKPSEFRFYENYKFEFVSGN